MKNYIQDTPKTHSEEEEFVKKNAPKIVDGIQALKRYFEDLKKGKIKKATRMQ
ncbi:MAG: hypothetical protein OER82_12770 [Nitrosopumilus sp.]|nr:hypothetical protein [Nitrosopumilus sp.]